MDQMSKARGFLQPRRELLELTVGQIMSPHAVTASPKTELGALADIMVSKSIHRLIVVEGDRTVGIVSVKDILHALRHQFRQ